VTVVLLPSFTVTVLTVFPLNVEVLVDVDLEFWPVDGFHPDEPPVDGFHPDEPLVDGFHPDEPPVDGCHPEVPSNGFHPELPVNGAPHSVDGDPQLSLPEEEPTVYH